MRSVGAFIEGFAGGQQQRRASDDRKAMLDAMEASRVAGAPGGFTGQGTEPQDGGGGGSGHAASRRGGKSYITSDPVAEGMAPYQKAFLNAVAEGESAGKYNVRYTPDGGVSFDGFDQHPGVFEKGPEGPSSAAGRYQFTKTTWDDTGGGAFTPERQDTRAWDLANDRYKATTGRDLASDLQARGFDDGIADALSPTWTSFRGQGGANAAAAYRSSLDRYGRPAPAAAPVERTVAAAAPAPKEWGALKRHFAA